MKNFYAIISFFSFVVSCTKEDKGDVTTLGQETNLTTYFIPLPSESPYN